MGLSAQTLHVVKLLHQRFLPIVGLPQLTDHFISLLSSSELDHPTDISASCAIVVSPYSILNVLYDALCVEIRKLVGEVLREGLFVLC